MSLALHALIFTTHAEWRYIAGDKPRRYRVRELALAALISASLVSSLILGARMRRWFCPLEARAGVLPVARTGTGARPRF